MFFHRHQFLFQRRCQQTCTNASSAHGGTMWTSCSVRGVTLKTILSGEKDREAEKAARGPKDIWVNITTFLFFSLLYSVAHHSIWYILLGKVTCACILGFAFSDYYWAYQPLWQNKSIMRREVSAMEESRSAGRLTLTLTLTLTPVPSCASVVVVDEWMLWKDCFATKWLVSLEVRREGEWVMKLKHVCSLSIYIQGPRDL